MATRSAIGIKHGSVIKAVYCHWDGYLLGNGLTLVESYQSSVKVNKLISMGNMSSIGEEIEDCKFYISDFGENPEDNCHQTFMSEEEYVDYYQYSDYYYLYDNGVWYYRDYKTKTFEPLEPAITLEALTQ